MIEKVKRIFGIEGIKVELVLPETVREKDGAVQGKLRFHTMHAQTVSTISLKMIERYSRGRGENKLVDEYQLAEKEIVQDIEVNPGEIVEVEFSLPFHLVKSDVEAFGSKNILFKGMAKAAQLTRNAKSVYRVEVEAKVRGTALSPIDKKEILVK